MLKEYDEFLKHASRVKVQYLTLIELKINLPTTDLVIQMDFAEHSTCSAMDKIQSENFNATPVTLHLKMLYFKNEDPGRDLRTSSLFQMLTTIMLQQFLQF